MKTKCPRLSPSPSSARFFCNYMQLPFVILCKQCLQHTNARSRRSDTTTNERTKRTTTAQNDCEKCFTHVKCTACPTTTIPFIRCQFADAIARESMWYVNICHTLIERYIECGIHLFFSSPCGSAFYLCASSSQRQASWDQNTAFKSYVEQSCALMSNGYILSALWMHGYGLS